LILTPKIPMAPVPPVSILLPFHNAASTLARALDSLRDQSFQNWELIAVDDGSSDGSASIARAAARHDPRIRVCSQSHSGIVPALNHGLSVARGPWMARMDADDESHPERLALQVQSLESDPSLGLISCRVHYGDDPIAHPGFARHVDWMNEQVTYEQLLLARFIESPIAHPSVMFRRELIDRHGGYREGAFPEDYELWLRWLDAGVRMAKRPERLLTWNDPPHRLSRVDPRYAFQAFYQTKSSYLARHLSRILSPELPRLAWGAGRLTRRRIEILEAAGVRINGFIDIDPNKQRIRPDGRNVIAPDAIPPVGSAFILGCVANWGARDHQRSFLEARGWSEGRDYLFVA